MFEIPLSFIVNSPTSSLSSFLITAYVVFLPYIRFEVIIPSSWDQLLSSSIPISSLRCSIKSTVSGFSPPLKLLRSLNSFTVRDASFTIFTTLWISSSVETPLFVYSLLLKPSNAKAYNLILVFNSLSCVV